MPNRNPYSGLPNITGAQTSGDIEDIRSSGDPSRFFPSLRRGQVDAVTGRILDVPRAFVYINGATVIGTNSGVQAAVPWDVLDYDTDGMFNSANNTRLTAHTPGVYQVDFLYSYQGNINGWRRSWIQRTNPTTGAFAYFGAFLNTDALGISCWLQSHWAIPMEAGEYVEGIYFQNSGGALNFNCGRDNCGFAATLISSFGSDNG